MTDEPPTSGCDPSKPLELFNRLTAELTEENADSDTIPVTSITPLDSGGYCGVLVRAIDDDESVRELVAPYAETEVALEFLIVPVQPVLTTSTTP